MNAARTHHARTSAGRPWALAAVTIAALLGSAACGSGGTGGTAEGPRAERTDAAGAPQPDGETTKDAPAEGTAAQAAPGARRLPQRLAVLTWNICGSASKCPMTDKPAEKIDEVLRVVRADSGYAVIMLQESCSKHRNPLAKGLGSGWVVRHRTAHYVGSNQRIVCGQDKENGAGVTLAMKRFPGSDFVKGGDGKPGWNVTFTSTRGWERDETKTSKPSTNRTTQGAVCLQDKGNKLLACTSHFVSEGVKNAKAIQNASVKDLSHTAAAWSKGGYRTIVGGDLNINVLKERPRLAPLYDGNFEADSNDNAPTHTSRKIDYLFFDDSGWKLRGGDVRVLGKGSSAAYAAGRLSDHWMLTAAVTPR
jgi:hypothetical protein